MGFFKLQKLFIWKNAKWVLKVYFLILKAMAMLVSIVGNRHFILALKSHNNRNSSKHQFSKCFPHNVIILNHSHINSQNITFTWRDTLCVCIYICVCAGGSGCGDVCVLPCELTHTDSHKQEARKFEITVFFLFYYYLFFVAQDLHFCARAFTSCSEQGPLFLEDHRLLGTQASGLAAGRL